MRALLSSLPPSLQVVSLRTLKAGSSHYYQKYLRGYCLASFILLALCFAYNLGVVGAILLARKGQRVSVCVCVSE